MAKEVILPKFGNSVEECLIKKWNKEVGDSVGIDEVLCEVETDKTTMDVPSTETGTILYRFYGEDEVVRVMQPIVIIGEEGEDIKELIELFSDSVKSTSLDTEKMSQSISIRYYAKYK